MEGDNKLRDSPPESDIYEVQEIVGMKKVDDINVYRVRWKGYGPQSDTWEPESNLKNVWNMVQKYRTDTKEKYRTDTKEKYKTDTKEKYKPDTKEKHKTDTKDKYKNNTKEKCKTKSINKASGTGRRRGRPAHNSITSNNSLVTREYSLANGIKHEKMCITEDKMMREKMREKMCINENKMRHHKMMRDRHHKMIRDRHHKMRDHHIGKNKETDKTEKNKDTFWKDLEEGRIDVFKEDLYSRVKIRASSRGNSMENNSMENNSMESNSMENSPKQNKNFDKCSWLHTDGNDNDTIDHQMDSDMRIKFCKTQALVAAIKESDIELVKILLKNGSEINSTFSNKLGATPLMIACQQNNINMVQFLLSHGAQKDIQDKNGDTALIISSRLGFVDIIKLLLIYGANFAVINKMGMNALRAAKTNEEKCSQEILVKHISILTISLELQVMNMLRNTAKIVHALFPIQCFSLNESPYFKLMFSFDEEKRHQPGVGYILFIANAHISNTEIRCKLAGPSAIQDVFLNSIPQNSLTEDAKFVFSFSPLLSGENQLIINTMVAETSRMKLIVCAYEAKLIADSCYNKQDHD